ncbi:MAG: DUF192 domain-containing protein [Bacteroidota bacterium]
MSIKNEVRDGMERITNIYRDNELLFTRVKVADDFITKLRGLMFYREMPGIDGLLLCACQMAHLFWMRFPLDLVYLNREKAVVFIETKYPNQLGRFVKNAYYVLEINAGTGKAKNIRVGDIFDWK